MEYRRPFFLSVVSMLSVTLAVVFLTVTFPHLLALFKTIGAGRFHPRLLVVPLTDNPLLMYYPVAFFFVVQFIGAFFMMFGRVTALFLYMWSNTYIGLQFFYLYFRRYDLDFTHIMEMPFTFLVSVPPLVCLVYLQLPDVQQYFYTRHSQRWLVFIALVLAVTCVALIQPLAASLR